MDSAPAESSSPEKVSYWIQRADYTSTPDSGPITLAQAQSLLRDHDWKTELDYKRELEAAEKDWCPPGIGFVADTDHILHICPTLDGVAECFFMEPHVHGSWGQNAGREEQDRLLELLFRGDYANLVQGFDPPAVKYWVQRADSTYRPDTGPITVVKAQSLLRDFDWKAELAYQRELEVAKKDWCLPTIGFSGAAGLLLIQSNNLGTFQCYVWNYDRSRSWGCDGLGPDEQSRILDLFYRGDRSLTQDWYEFEVETYTDEEGRQLTRAKPADSDAWLRAHWLAQIKQTRARRGQPRELTEEERNLSEKDALALHFREVQLEAEERRREETIKAARSSRKWCVIISAGGTLLAGLLYSGVLQDWLWESLIKDLWAYSTLAMAGGLVIGGLHHLELRALLLGTELARKQANFAKAFCGTVVFLGCAVGISAVLTLFLGLVVPWDRLSPSLGNLFTALDNKRGFLTVTGILLIIMGLTIGGAYVWRRSSKPEEPELASIFLAGGMSVGSFAVLAVGPFVLMFTVFAAAISLMELGFTGAGDWVKSNFALVTVLMLPVMAILVPIAFLYGRRRAPEWESKTFTLVGAGIRVVGIFFFGSMGAFLLVLVAAFLKANGLLG